MPINDGGDDVDIRSSRIHGKGLYAGRFFKAGDVVLRWKLDQRIDSTDLANLPAEERKYLHPLDEKTFVVLQAPERYVNHSCNNNTAVRHCSDVAVRDIQVGEEITSDYSSDGSGQSFACSCGANNCRQVIGSKS